MGFITFVVPLHRGEISEINAPSIIGAAFVGLVDLNRSAEERSAPALTTAFLSPRYLRPPHRYHHLPSQFSSFSVLTRSCRGRCLMTSPHTALPVAPCFSVALIPSLGTASGDRRLQLRVPSVVLRTTDSISSLAHV